MTKILIPPLVLSLLFFTGCASSGGGGNVGPEDIQEAQIVEQGLRQTSDIQGKYFVTPGAKFTTVTFTEPNIPEKPEELRQSMKGMREFISFQTGREANKLRFVFPGLIVLRQRG